MLEYDVKLSVDEIFDIICDLGFCVDTRKAFRGSDKNPHEKFEREAELVSRLCETVNLPTLAAHYKEQVKEKENEISE